MTDVTLAGHGRFIWFDPQGRRATDYEDFTVGANATPATWLDVGWPVREPDGSDQYRVASTAMRCVHWDGYREPARRWNRPFIAQTNQHEQTLAMLLANDNSGAGLLAALRPGWRDTVLGPYYGVMPFLCNARVAPLAHAVREALSGTVAYMLAFQIGDAIRQLQDIAGQLLSLGAADPSFSDAAARRAWMEDPVLQPTRQLLERLHGIDDWLEYLAASALFAEPLCAQALREFFLRSAPINGDALTPFVMTLATQDMQTHRASILALFSHLFADVTHGDANRHHFELWCARWGPAAQLALDALAPLWELPAVQHAEPFPACRLRIIEDQRNALRTLG